MNNIENSMDTKRFWLGVFLIVVGMALLFAGMIFDPKGEIHGSVLGAFGEIATLAGALLGMDAYTSFKIRREMKKNN